MVFASLQKGFEMRYGYETAGGDRVTALRDMFDGGGAGRSGDEFEGGGILSLIANLLASPYGSQRDRAAGIIDQPTRPPRTRPAPPSAAESLLNGEDATDDYYRYFRQGGPGGLDVMATPLQTAEEPTIEERTYQQAMRIINDPTAPLELKQRAQKTLLTLQRMPSFDASVPR